MPITALLGKPPTPDDIEELSCGLPPKHLPEDRARRNQVLTRPEKLCMEKLHLTISVLRRKEGDERDVQKDSKGIFL